MRRRTLAALATVLAVAPAAGAVATAPDEPARVPPSSSARYEQTGVIRLSGSGRVETAVAVSQASFDPGVGAVFLATSTGFADALSGGPAAAELGAPLLLTQPDALSDATAAEIRRLAPAQIYLLGGAKALSPAVEDAARELADDVERISGSDRYATAALVRERFLGARNVFLSTGTDFPDALAGGAVAYPIPHPDGAQRPAILLTPRDGLAEATRASLAAAPPDQIWVLGGTGAVSDAAEAQAAELVAADHRPSDGQLPRFAGPGRFATAALIADHLISHRTPDVVFVATGRSFPDALAGAPASLTGPLAPILLVERDSIPTETAATLASLRDQGLRLVVILGGPGAVSTAVESSLQAYVGGTSDGTPGGDTVTLDDVWGASCADPAGGTTYEVGPGQALAAIGDVPWEDLGPGDRVQIHARTTPYREKILLANQGTADAPISVCGIADADGNRPVLDGEDATTRPGMESMFERTQDRGLITVSPLDEDVWGDKPEYIVIEGLEITGAHPAHTFTDFAGELQSYPDNAAGVFVERGEYISIRDNVIRGNGNGVFVASGDSEEALSRDILVHGNEFVDNSVSGRDREHHSYIEAERTTYQFNWYRDITDGAFGGALKDRSAGTVVRFNHIEGGRRAIDLVEADGAFPMLGGLSSYRSAWVYGNTFDLRNHDSISVVHYGGDLGDPATYRKGTLYFHGNTVSYRMDRDVQYHATMFDISTNDETVEAWDNIFHAEADTAGSEPVFLFAARGEGAHHFGTNLVSPSIGDVRDADEYAETFDGTVTGWADRLVAPETGPGFVDLEGGDLRLAEGSPAIDAAGPAPVTVPGRHALVAQFDPVDGIEARTRVGAAMDVGAHEYGAAGADPAPDPEPDPGTGGGTTVDAGPPAADRTFDLGGASAGLPCGSTVHCVSAGADLQSVIDAAADGDTVQVAAGTYTGSLDLAGRRLVLVGGFAAGSDFGTREPAANTTTLQGDNGAVVAITGGADVTVDGFTITGGDGLPNEFTDGGDGGGIAVQDAAATITNNVVTGNAVCATDCSGGGISISSSDVTLQGNVIEANDAWRGGGIFASGGTIEISDNLIADNVGHGDHGGGLWLFGDLVVRRNIIRGNSIGEELGYGWGGGILVVEAGDAALLQHNRVHGNSAPTRGSGIFIDEGATATIDGDLVYGNACGDDAAGIYVDGSFDGRGSTVTITNVTVADHPCSGGTAQGLFVEGGSSVTVTNSIFHDNGDGDVGLYNCEGDDLANGSCVASPTPTSLTVAHSIVGNASGTGTFDADPSFVDAAAGDYHLASSSPAIDAADASAPVGDEPAPNGDRRNLGSYGGTAAATTSG